MYVLKHVLFKRHTAISMELDIKMDICEFGLVKGWFSQIYIHVAEQTETSCVSHIKVTRELTGDLSKT